jgi:hypothetical protein
MPIDDFIRRSARITRRCLAALCVALLAAPALAAVSDIDLVVPHKTAPGQLAIARLLLTVQVNDDSPIAFNFTLTEPPITPDTTPTIQTHTTPSMAPGDADLDTDGVQAAHQFLFGSDLITVYPPDAGLPADDPRRRNYRVNIQPNGDFDDVSCVSTMAGDETWTLAVDGGQSRLVNACLVSQDENTSALPLCDGNYRVVPASEPFAEIGGLDAPEQVCRFGVEAMLVLDRSGSMGSPAPSANPVGDTRMDALRQAVTAFTATLDSVRTTAAGNGLSVPTDRVGVAIFNGDAEPLPGLAPGLGMFDAALKAGIDTQLAAVAPGGVTSIGDGLIEGAGFLGGAGGDVRRLILLMSDGLQNTDQRVSVIDGSIVTHGGGTACPQGASSPGCDALPNPGNYGVCSVTTGLTTPVQDQINQAIALAGDCFYQNSQVSIPELTEFFVGVLQSFLEAGTWQTLLTTAGAAAEGSPAAFSVPVTTTTLGVAATLSPRDGAFVCLEALAPGQTSGQRVCDTDTVTLQAALGQLAAGAATRDMGGDWTFRVEAPRASPKAPAGFNLTVLADDVGVHARAELQAGDFAPGEPIRVAVRLDDHGEPLTGLTDLKLRLDGPALTLGELMAGYTSQGDTPALADVDPANAAVQAALAGDPAIVLQEGSEIPLVENEPGVYAADFALARFGNTNLLLDLRGEAPSAGAFQRQLKRTVFIKALPDPDATEVSAQVLTGPDGNRLAVQLTPKTKGGFPVGPGWQNYYWITAPGLEPFKLDDQLNGTYARTIAFAGDQPPALSVHFIPGSVSIGDAVPVSELPSPLDASTVLVADVGADADDGLEPVTWWWLLLLILALLLLIVIVYAMRKAGSAP